jgi:hypothetical protein
MTRTPMRIAKTPEYRALIFDAARAADPAMDPAAVLAAVDAVLTHPAIARDLAAALAEDPAAVFASGAPAVATRLITALRERGSTLPLPGCVVCGRTGFALIRTSGGGVCERCRRRQLATACSRCGIVKPVAGRDPDGRPCCARCADRPQRPCGQCGHTRRIARRAHDGNPDICENCYQLPEAVCARCHRRRPCSFATTQEPVCTNCAPRRTEPCSHCGQHRPPTARWPEGPVCDPCYQTALRRRGTCTGCGQHRRLVTPPGPAATRCADCAGHPLRGQHVCTDCGLEDKLYERGRCNSCALRRRTTELLRGPHDTVPADLVPVFDAITSTHAPRSALNWLRKGAGAAVLAELAAGALECSHAALDAHPRRQPADYLRHILVVNGVIPARDDAVASTERMLTARLADIERDHDRRIVHAYATWRVLRRLRVRAERHSRPRSVTAHARDRINIAVAFLDWLADRGTTLADATQDDVDTWLTTAQTAYRVRDFLLWAHSAGRARQLAVPTPGRTTGTSIADEQRWGHVKRLLHDDDLDLTDRVAGCLLLLYGQPLSRITAMTTEQITERDRQTYIRFNRDEVHIPEPLATLIRQLAEHKRAYQGVGTPAARSTCLIPGLQPGRPLTPSRLGERLRAIGIYAMPGRRAAMTHLAAQLPAAVIADLLNIAPTTAVNWVRAAGGDWSRYAADLARTTDHEPRGIASPQ